jgi:hypothetical protein
MITRVSYIIMTTLVIQIMNLEVYAGALDLREGEVVIEMVKMVIMHQHHGIPDGVHQC